MADTSPFIVKGGWFQSMKEGKREGKKEGNKYHRT